MSKFNNTATYSMPEITENHEGFAAYAMDDKSKLVTQVLTSFFNEEKFYGDNSEEIKEPIKNVIKKDPKFVSNLAIFARREFNMRSISHVLAGYLANIPEGKPFVKRTVKNIILRGDDATEILAFYLATFGKPIPNSLRKALREVFPTFDAYTLAKYKGDSKSVKMRDILCLCRPSPLNEKQSETWKALLEGTLQPAYTWETELSAKGNNKETWEELIDSGKVGYMALLRNLRNILNADPNNIRKVLDRIANPDEVRKSKQLPFRFMSAYRMIQNETSWNRAVVLEAIEAAADCAVENLPKIPGRTIIAIDTSGSMRCTISGKSDIRCCDISALLGIIASRICEKSRVFTFDNYIHEMVVPRRSGIISAAIEVSHAGGGTDMTLPFNKLIKDKIDCDRLIILSDNECNGYTSVSSWAINPRLKITHKPYVQVLAEEYRKLSGNNIWVHAIDLMGYGTQQFAGPKTNIIAGWSEKVFEFIQLAELGEGSLIKKIESYMD
ncbi:MAG: TROVE domain-containing protein [Bacteroidota bacterium]|nr:TROVE domain-containing protein [Bacteroidota bacterium]